MGQSSQRTVVVITTGGTIASRVQHGAVVAADSGHDLVSRVAADAGVHLVVRDLARKGSYQLDLGDLRRISEQVAATWREVPDAAGVVITHGTDTLEETAFLLDLVHAGATRLRQRGRCRPGQGWSDPCARVAGQPGTRPASVCARHRSWRSGSAGDRLPVPVTGLRAGSGIRTPAR